jgi:hypothetical protein
MPIPAAIMATTASDRMGQREAFIGGSRHRA